VKNRIAIAKAEKVAAEHGRNPFAIARRLGFRLTYDRLPDGSPNHITAVFLLGSDGRQKRQYRGMVMNSDAVVTQVKNMLEREGAS